MSDRDSSGNKYTGKDLKIMQSWDLDRKVQVSQTRLIEWYKNWDGKCYVSFSGGKDSTILAYLAAQVCVILGYKLILWFSDTGMEFPEIREHVKKFPSYLQDEFPDLQVELLIIPPTYSRVDKDLGKKKGDRITFRDVIKKYGYPIVSKEVADIIYETRRNPNGTRAQRLTEGSPMHQKYGDKWMILNWKFLLDAPFKISGSCCYAMKKSPAKRYERASGNKRIIGSMASESRLRMSVWLRDGCNSFDTKVPSSKPLSFWTEQDILKFIHDYNIPIATIYGEVIQRDDGEFETTGEDRTGCMFCGFGCHLEKEPNRFQRLKLTHPQIWEYCMKPYEEGGLGMKEVLEFLDVKTGSEDENHFF